MLQNIKSWFLKKLPILRKNEDWLRYRTVKELKKKHPSLFPSLFQKAHVSLVSLIRNKNGWIVVFPIVFLMFLISLYIDVYFLNIININHKTVEILVDQRTSNIATLASLSLIVAGFLLTNLARKDAISYQLLFEKTYLYPTIYLTLSTIACLFLISTTRDSLSPQQFINSVLAGTYISILILLMIGILFRSIVQFTDINTLHKLQKNEILKAGRTLLRESLISDFSKKIVADIYEEYKVKEDDLKYHLINPYKSKKSNEDNSEPKKIIENKRIVDINLKQLESSIRSLKEDGTKEEGTIHGTVIGIGDRIDSWQNLLEIDIEQLNKIYRNSVVLEDDNIRKHPFDTRRDYYDNIIDRDLDTVLDVYYQLYLDELSINVKDILTKGIVRIISVQLKREYENDDKTRIDKLENFIRKALQLSIQHDSLYYFEMYARLIISYYTLSYRFNILKTRNTLSHDETSDKVISKLRSIILYDLSNEFKKEEEKLDNTNYYAVAFGCIGDILYKMTRNNDWTNLSRAIKKIDNQIPKKDVSGLFMLKLRLRGYQQQQQNTEEANKMQQEIDKYASSVFYNSYRNNVLLSIKYWIYFVYLNGDYDKKMIVDVLRDFSSINFLYYDFTDRYKNLIEIIDKSRSGFMGWRDWDYKDRLHERYYSPPMPQQWLLLGFLIDVLKEEHFSVDIKERTHEEMQKLDNLISDIKRHLKYIVDNYHLFKDLIGEDDIDTIKSRADKFEKDLDNIKHNIDLISNSEIVKLPLDQSKVRNLFGEVHESWKRNIFMRRLFHKYKNLKISENSDSELMYMSGSHFLQMGKKYFIDSSVFEQSIAGLSEIGRNVARCENNYFITCVLQSDNDDITAQTVIEVIINCIYRLQEIDIKPNVIFMNRSMVYHDKTLINDHQFIHYQDTSDDIIQDKDFLLGRYKGIPVYLINSKYLLSKVIVCDFERSFEMVSEERADRKDNVLHIDVKEISDERANKILEGSHQSWTETQMNLSDEEAITLIKTSVDIECWTRLGYNILDTDAYVVGSLKDER